ncbi:MAG: hypothetical protein KA163_04950 [Bacteroidia bacterium]|nr:hypothetical protein [Bacteroidia bacterium]
MKKIILMLLVILNGAKAQDTIRFRSGDVQAVKVNEVGLTEINYNRFDNLQGPKYVVEKSDVSLIKYAGGHIDSFKVVAPVVKATEFKIVDAETSSEKIIITGNRLIYRGNGLGESRLFKMVRAHPEGEKKNAMMKTYYQMRQYKKNQYICGFGIGLGVGLGAPYIGMIASVISGEFVPLVVGVAIGGTIGMTGAILSSINKKKRNDKKLELARLYNN